MSVIQDNLDRLAGYPLDAVGSVAADNVEKLRTFSVADIRRTFLSTNTEVVTSSLKSPTLRTFATVLIP